MNHGFHPSQLDVSICGICKFNMLAHTDMATCECCKNIGPVDVKYGNMLMCKDCQDKELKAYAENNTPAKQAERVDALNEAIAKARQIDDSITVRTDLFNAATVSIEDLKKAIDADVNITNKHYALAEELSRRLAHYRAVIFEAQETIVKEGNNQKATQVYLNQLANKLRAEEREKLKIQDINYKPPMKPVKVSQIRNSKKFDKDAVRKLAHELGIGESTIQMLVISKGMSVEAIGNMLRKSINEAKSETK
jgi:uncharacterized coiled-coil protein SlyX